jgi:isochorismate hydrolase
MSKEAYFTTERLREQSLRMRAALETQRQRHAGQGLRKETAALLVLDMQSYFLRSESHAFVPSAPAIVPGIQRLIESFQRAARPIVFTRHLNTSADAGQMDKWWKDIIEPQSPDSGIIEELDSANGIVLHKAQYDAFLGTVLDQTLRSRAVEQVVISGVMTHLCCETTARSAFMRGYEVFFTIDGTATYEAAFHEAALLNLAHGFAVLVLVDEVLEALGD